MTKSEFLWKKSQFFLKSMASDHLTHFVKNKKRDKIGAPRGVQAGYREARGRNVCIFSEIFWSKYGVRPLFHSIFFVKIRILQFPDFFTFCHFRKFWRFSWPRIFKILGPRIFQKISDFWQNVSHNFFVFFQKNGVFPGKFGCKSTWKNYIFYKKFVQNDKKWIFVKKIPNFPEINGFRPFDEFCEK